MSDGVSRVIRQPMLFVPRGSDLEKLVLQNFEGILYSWALVGDRQPLNDEQKAALAELLWDKEQAPFKEMPDMLQTDPEFICYIVRGSGEKFVNAFNPNKEGEENG